MEAQIGSSPDPETSTGLPPTIAAGVACLFGVVGGIIFLFLEKKNSFVRFYAMQSVLFSGGLIALAIISQIFTAIIVHVPVLGWLITLILGMAWGLLGIASLVIYIITIIKALSGVEWEIPVLGPMARKQLGSLL